MPHNAGEIARSETTVKRTDLRTGLAELRIVRRDREITDDMEDMTTADRIARHHRDDRLRQGSDLFLHIKDVQSRDAVIPDVTGMTAHFLIASRAKGEIASHLPRDANILSVYVPTTPAMTSGFLIYVNAADVILLDMKIEDTAKLIISAGLVYPNQKDPGMPVV